MTFNEFVKKLDLFGLNYEFLIDGETNYKTNTGGYITISYFIICVGLFFGFGIDFYQRNNPKVVFDTKIADYTKVYLSNKNYTLAYRVEDNNGIIVLNTSVVEPILNYFYSYIDNTTGVWISVFDYRVNKTRCKELPNIKEKELYYNISLTDWYCVYFDNLNVLGGNWDGNFVYGIYIDTHQCTNSTGNNNSCLPYQNISDKYQNNVTGNNLFFSFLYLEGLPMMSDYNNPLKTHLKIIMKCCLCNCLKIEFILIRK